jgi:hypothetical protein
MVGEQGHFAASDLAMVQSAFLADLLWAVSLAHGAKQFDDTQAGQDWQPS